MKRNIPCEIILILVVFSAASFAKEGVKYGLGCERMNPVEYKQYLRRFPEVKAKDHFDWRDSGAVTPAGYQGDCGSCWAFAISGCLESHYLIEYGIEYNLSEQYIISCNPDSQGCCGGGSHRFEFYYDHEPVAENCFPYTDGNTSCYELPNCPPQCSVYPCDYHICPGLGSLLVEDSYFTVDLDEPLQVIASLERDGPAWFSFGVHDDFLTYWDSPEGTTPWHDGVYVNHEASYQGGHAVLLIGYDSNAEYWILKNSWGIIGGPFGDGTFKMAWSGHEADVIWGMANVEVANPPFTPTPSPTPTITPTPTNTFIPPVNNSCPGTDIPPDSCICGELTGAQNNHDCDGEGDIGKGKDVVYHFVNLIQGAEYRIIGEAEFNSDWSIGSTCSGSIADILCTEYETKYDDPSCSSINGGYYSNLDFTFTAEQTEYWFWVDSHWYSVSGEYCFEIITANPAPPTPTPQTAVIYVPDDYSTIQAAINAADDADTVLVSDGTFSGAGNTDLSFLGKPITVQSLNGPEQCIIDGGGSSQGFVFDSSETNQAYLLGFTIRNCIASGSFPANCGAALYCDGSSPTIINCNLENNAANAGAGAFLMDSQSILMDCNIRNNNAASVGGGVVCYDNASPSIFNCLITGNTVTSGSGGGVACSLSSDPELTHCTLCGNTATDGGGLYTDISSLPVLLNCIVWSNSPDSITAEITSPSVTFSNIQMSSGTYSGAGNINVNPKFEAGPEGDYYLNFPISPSIDSGNNLAQFACMDTGRYKTCMFHRTTRIDGLTDSNLADQGYHYETDIAPTSTPTPTFTPSPTPTAAPSGSPGIIRVPADYSTIQAGIDAAVAGNTVLVAPGTYTGDGNRNIDLKGKPILLQSENIDPTSCIIDLQGLNNRGFYIKHDETSNTVIAGFTVRNSNYQYWGGAMKLSNCSLVITNCIFENNSADNAGAMYITSDFQDIPRINNCIFRNNTAEWYGGGVQVTKAKPIFTNCLFYGNMAKDGGGLEAHGGYPEATLINCTFSGNTADPNRGSGIYCVSTTMNLTNCLIWGNTTDNLKWVTVEATADYCNIQQDSGTYPGTGNINADPLFTTGPKGDYYLQQLATGDPQDSPCVDTGSTAATAICFTGFSGNICMNELSTQIDMAGDTEQVDIGFHYWSLPGETTPTPVFTATPTATSIPQVLHVPEEYTRIQTAINAASNGDIVMVGNGTWSGPGNRELDFAGKNLTLRSKAGPEYCILNGDNAYPAIVFDDGESANAVVQGFTFTNCANTQGGAISIDHADPVIIDCIFTDNNASAEGGAVAAMFSESAIYNCVFTRNNAPSGGAVYAERGSNPVFMINCLFDSNTAINGGAVFGTNTARITMTNCTLSANSATSSGGALFLEISSQANLANSIAWINLPHEMSVDSTSTCSTGYSDIHLSSGVYPGVGNINEDPKFIVGPRGNFYLDSRFPSPCIDTGILQAADACYTWNQGHVCLDTLTTRFNSVPDSGIVDMGFHYGKAQTITVPDEYSTIQDAIDAASNGDVILLSDGTYSGTGNIDLDTLGKSISLVSQNGSSTCIIDCHGQGRGFHIHSSESEQTVISGLTVRNGLDATTGGAFLIENASPLITNCTLFHNEAPTGAGFHLSNSAAMLTNLILNENSATDGAGISAINSNPEIANCLLLRNDATGTGGGIRLINCSEEPLIYNCTFSQNSSINPGGAIYCNETEPLIVNSILWDDSPDELECQYAGSGRATVSYTCIMGGYQGTGVISDDPEFASGPMDGYYLNPSHPVSPCIDAGTGQASTVCFRTDGNDVCLNQLASRSDGVADSRTADMGFHHPAILQPTATPTNTPTPTVTSAPTPRIIRVPQEFNTIQGGIAAARTGDIVLIADGTYSGTGNFDLSIADKKVHIISETGPLNCVIDCNGRGRGILCSGSACAGAIVQGLTIREGLAKGTEWPLESGGGILCINGANIRFLDCIIIDSTARNGGGFAAVECSPSLQNCIVARNSLSVAGSGGGIYGYLSNMQVDNSTIADNTAVSSYTGRGGGFFFSGACSPNFVNTIIWNNAPDGLEYFEAVPVIRYCCLQENYPAGTNIIYSNPQLITGLAGNYYLDSRHRIISPCIDAGEFNADSTHYTGIFNELTMSDLTTQSDQARDSGTVDMGFHYPAIAAATATPVTTPSTPVATPSPVPTGIQQGILNGEVSLERSVPAPHDSWIIPLSITLCSGGSRLEYATSTYDDGSFDIQVAAGIYDVLVKGDHTLAVLLEDVEIPYGNFTNDLDFGTLPEGDANNDNVVTSTDFFILRFAYNTMEGDPNFDPRADFNNDGVVTSTDFFLLREHYNQAGEDCPAGLQ